MTPSDSWQPLDIDARDAAFPSPPGEGTHVVALLAAPDSCRTGWAARAALRIARHWAVSGSDVLLADVNFESPQLHLTAGVDNREGISDALLFGSSFQRVSLPAGDGLVLAAAGTAIPDAESLRAHPRWRDFAAGFQDAGALLALYLPAGAPGADALLELCDAALVLAGRDEAGIELPRSVALLGAVGPETVPAAAAVDDLEDASGVPAPESVPDEGVRGGEPAPVEPLAIDPPDQEQPAAEPPVADPPPAPTLEEILGDGAAESDAAGEMAAPLGPDLPPPVHPQEELLFKPRRTSPREKPARGGGGLLLALLAVVALALVAGWMGWVTIPGITPRDDAAAPQETAMATLAEAEAAEPGTGESADGAVAPGADGAVTDAAEEGDAEPVAAPPPVAAFAVALASYSDLEDALRRTRILSRANPQFTFLVAPVEVRGQAYFRVLAGSAGDPDEAVALRESLAAAMPGSSQWILRQAGMAYLLGSLPDLDSAELTVEELRGRGVPAHILRVDGGPRGAEYRVYSGAYASAAEARFMEGFLKERGIGDAVLTQRLGVVPG